MIKEIFRSYGVLDSEGRHINGTDKETNHSYGDAYEELFDLYVGNDKWESGRKNVELMMEIGIADGSSLLAWRDIFPNAICVGMDIHPPSWVARGIGTERLEFCLGNQRSLEDCRRAADGRQFDLIVEDATHQLEDTLLTLLYFWRFVKPGGLYIVEEFANIGALRGNVEALWQDRSGCGEAVNVRIVDTTSPFGGVEPLVVFRKPL